MKTQVNCDGDGLSRRDLLKAGGVVALGVVVAAVPGVAKADTASNSSRPPDSQNSKAHGQLIDGTSGKAVLLGSREDWYQQIVSY